MYFSVLLFPLPKSDFIFYHCQMEGVCQLMKPDGTAFSGSDFCHFGGSTFEVYFKTFGQIGTDCSRTTFTVVPLFPQPNDIIINYQRGILFSTIDMICQSYTFNTDLEKILSL